MKSEKPVIWNVLGLKKKQFLVFKLVWSNGVEQIPDLQQILTEVFALIPDIPVIFPLPEGMPISFIDQIDAPNLVLTGFLKYTEISYLLCNSLGVIIGQPCISDEIVMMNVNCSTNSAF